MTHYGNRPCDHLGKRTAIMFGLTFDSVSSSDGRIENLVHNSGLVVGIGYNVLDFLRISAGGLFSRINKAEPPAKRRFELHGNGFVSASLDINLVQTMQDFVHLLVP